MIHLRRSVRLKEELLLPNGERVSIDLDVEDKAYELNSALCALMSAAVDVDKDPTNEAASAEYNSKREQLIRMVLGAAAFDKAVQAYDGHKDELCKQLDNWMAERVLPLMREASQRRLETMRQAAKVAERKQRWKLWWRK